VGGGWETTLSVGVALCGDSRMHASNDALHGKMSLVYETSRARFGYYFNGPPRTAFVIISAVHYNKLDPMDLTVVPEAFVTSIQFILVLGILSGNLAQLNQCGETEVRYLGSDQSPEIYCNCNTSSIQCWWTKFTNRKEILSSGTSTAVLMWQRIGYGQYLCIRDNSTVIMNLLILPNGK